MTDYELYDKIDEFFENYYWNKASGYHTRLDLELQDFLASHEEVESKQWERVYPRIQFNTDKLRSIFK